ncbi:NAD-dependent epimerase/dehydratase family protein [Spirochaeta thermophila]|uniref:Protein CapI n=1 Tax=Winmispira thermophila (strain ATCC 49972 / DSM 6192 / RI 19.B1) TaxID=665571 RepID=E0RTX0_WINT6|nr:NAD-dependent epimerase/dehydratase family protein [Spirochaeta thermophila]ADN01026.1 protein CapI [Spirochaeta thermophila DSM 6192]
MRFLVTGSAGFVGFHLVDFLLRKGHEVVGIDNLSPYYDVGLKKARLAEHGIVVGERGEGMRSRIWEGYIFYFEDVRDRVFLETLLRRHGVERVIHLAAQAGVRYSLTHPEVYLQSNIEGFWAVLEASRRCGVERLVYASTSSVYGLNEKVPFSERDGVDHPVSLYAATKRSNELFAHVYSHIYGLPTIGLRFFTVYGPWGRPDMAYFSFTERILKGEPIEVFNHGHMERDFTYVEDVVEGVARVAEHPLPERRDWDPGDPRPDRSSAPFWVYNIGHGSPVGLMDFIRAIEEALGREARIVYREMQPGDVVATHASTKSLEEAVGYRPSTPLSEGIRRFVAWYCSYYGIER